MRKSTLFISATLTTFMLAVLFGVASAYQGIVNATKTTPQAQPVPVSQQVSQPVLPTQAAAVTPEQAASLAAQVIGRTDLYSVEMTTFNGTDAYLVTFSSGDLVYVGLDGQILSISKLPVTIINQPSGSSGNNPTINTSGSQEGGEHEGGEGGDD
jgi:hypothetical protein